VEKITDLIDKKGANPNVLRERDHKTLLIWLCMLGRREVEGAFHSDVKTVFRFLLSRHNINVNFRESNGNMLIHYVSDMADGWFLNILLMEKRESCAYINSLDSVGLAPLHLVCGSTVAPIQNITKLLDKGAIPNQRSGDMGRTPLHYALLMYRLHRNLDRLTEIFDSFFKFGFYLDNQVDNEGNTILHVVAKTMNNAGFCTKILNNGGDKSLYVQNGDGFTPLEEAMQRQGHDGVVLAIERFMRRGARGG
jgi:ankyrin repeat protein